MDAKEYCENMSVELSNWKDEVCDILGTVEGFPPRDKKALSPQIASLRYLVLDLTAKIDRIKETCPLDWGAVSADLQRSVAELRKNVASMWGFFHTAGEYVGG
jgi:hypothetical protein